MKLFETVILALLTLSHTHTHTAVNEGGVHPPGLLYYICSQLLAEWKKERRRREDFTVTKWSEGFGGGGHATLVEDKANNCSRLQHPWAEEVCGPGRGVQQPITKRTQTTGRQKQTRQGTEPICSASRVSAHFAQTGGRAQPLTAETPLILTQIKKKRLAARSLSVFSELLHTCNTSLSLIVWRGTKASQGGVGGEKKEEKKGLWRRHQARDKRKWYYETLINICVYYSLSSAHIWLISNRQLLTLDTDRTGRLRHCFSGLLHKTFPSQRMEMDPPDWSIGSHWFAL